MSTAKVAIICDDQRMTQKLVQEITFYNIAIDEVIDKPREAYLKINPKEPRVIVFVEPAEELSVIQVMQQLHKVNTAAPILFLTMNEDFQESRRLFRAGVTDVLKVPEELPELQRSMERAFRQLGLNRQKVEMDKPTVIKGAGTVISVYSGKGGAGTSLLAANLANSLALQGGQRVLLVDLNLQFGGIQTLFNIRHDRHLGDLMPVIHELTESQLNNVLYRMETTHLHILLSPNSPEESENVKSEEIELLLFACRSCFDLVILDIPKELNEISVSALNHSDHIFYIAELERPAIVRMQNVLDLLDRYHLINDNNVSIIVNRFCKKRDIGLEELQRMSRFPVHGTIADDFRQLQRFINLGLPWLQQSKQKVKRGPVKDLVKVTASTLQLVGGE
ncbi:AAA family ATPase [Brevibacillus humidisoli]|uniref:AAA family ATPase n=1 Tax=Brevibacillus humidisoli TaxID=2895522 RepID=UPI001E41B8BF|nr:AAA family ATPase [Brevibacillus humidisoli]UFJ40795.1 AAA family ATPase [Brevibacillus humidisoli]